MREMSEEQKNNHLRVYRKLLRDGVDPQKVVNILGYYVENVNNMLTRSYISMEDRELFIIYRNNAIEFRDELINKYKLSCQ